MGAGLPGVEMHITGGSVGSWKGRSSRGGREALCAQPPAPPSSRPCLLGASLGGWGRVELSGEPRAAARPSPQLPEDWWLPPCWSRGSLGLGVTASTGVTSSPLASKNILCHESGHGPSLPWATCRMSLPEGWVSSPSDWGQDLGDLRP